MNNKIIVGIIGGIVGIILLFCIYELAISDKTGPVITYDNEEITYTQGQDDSVLLEGVTAKDKRDGNVTDSLFVYQKIVLGNGDTMKIIYAAMDSKKNISINDDRVVKYVATEEDSNDDKKDDADDENKESSQESTTPTETTSAGPNDPTGQIDKTAADASGIPVIKLNSTEATITVGQFFDVISYVRETYDNSGDVSRRIRVDGVYDIAVPGDYKLNYLVSDTEGNVSEAAPFTLHIVPAPTEAVTEPVNTESAAAESVVNQDTPEETTTPVAQ